MKTIFTILALICVQNSFAQDFTDLQTDDVAITAATGEIISKHEICPHTPGRMTCMAYGTMVNVQVDLNGCLDHLGGHFEKFEVKDGKGIIYFSAINVANEGSKTARCYTKNTTMVQVFVPFEGQIELVNMKYTAAQK